MELLPANGQTRIIYGSGALVLIVAVLSVDYGLLALLCLAGALWFGWTRGDEMILRASTLISAHVTERVEGFRLSEGLEGTAAPVPPEIEAKNRREMPWKGIFVGDGLNESLEILVDELLDYYVSSWYETSVSRDRTFVAELRYQIRYCSAQFVRRVWTVDLVNFLTREALPICARHVKRVREASKDVSDKESHVLESRILSAWKCSHWSCSNKQSFDAYIRSLAELLIGSLLDESRIAGRDADHESPLKSLPDELRKHARPKKRPWPAHAPRHLLREVVAFGVLKPLVDLLVDPDFINRIVELTVPDPATDLVDCQPRVLNCGTTRVELLYGLGEWGGAVLPDSLLQLRLGDILASPRLSQAFALFLDDSRAPSTEFCFLKKARELLDRFCHMNALPHAEIAFDAWQLYSEFIHPANTADRLEMTEDERNQWSVALKSGSLEPLQSLVESAFGEVYSRVQSQFVIAFCQSEAFLGQLAGTPPAINLLEEDRVDSAKRAAGGKTATFSVAQMKSRLWRFLSVGAVEGSPMPSSTSSSGRSRLNDSVASTAADVLEIAALAGDPDAPISPKISDKETEEAIEVFDEQETKSGASLLVIDQTRRDMNRWRVNVQRIVPDRNPDTGAVVFVYSLLVERTEAAEDETRCWNVRRQFHEFYVLESKLAEFHGDCIRTHPLPTKKPFVTKTRNFLEQQMPHINAFLSRITSMPALRRSDLLFAFLTSDEQFDDTLTLGDLNPWRVVKKMPAKLTKERGQNLRPFLLDMLAKTLAPPTAGTSGSDSLSTNTTACSSSQQLTRSTTTPSLNALGASETGSAKERFAMTPEPVKLTESEVKVLQHETPIDREPIFTPLHWIWGEIHGNSIVAPIVAALHALFAPLLNRMIQVATTIWLRQMLLSETNLNSLVRLIQWSLFHNDDVPTAQERELRRRLAKRRLLEAVKASTVARFFISHELIETTFDAMQHSRLNQVLVMQLLDALVANLYPEATRGNIVVASNSSGL